jgi:hypothetical protein
VHLNARSPLGRGGAWFISALKELEPKVAISSASLRQGRAPVRGGLHRRGKGVQACGKRGWIFGDDGSLLLLADFKAVSRSAILAKLSEAAPGSPSTVSAFAGVRRPQAGPSGVAEPLVRAGWLAWRRLGGGQEGRSSRDYGFTRRREARMSGLQGRKGHATLLLLCFLR